VIPIGGRARDFDRRYCRETTLNPDEERALNQDISRSPSQPKEAPLPTLAFFVVVMPLLILMSANVTAIVMCIVELFIWLHGLLQHWIHGHLQGTRGLVGEIVWGGFGILTLAVFAVLSLGSTSLAAFATDRPVRGALDDTTLRSPITIWAIGVPVTIVGASVCLAMLQAFALEMPVAMGRDGELEQARFLVRLDAVLAEPALLVPRRLISSIAPVVFIIVSLCSFAKLIRFPLPRESDQKSNEGARSATTAARHPRPRSGRSSPPPIAW